LLSAEANTLTWLTFRLVVVETKPNPDALLCWNHCGYAAADRRKGDRRCFSHRSLIATIHCCFGGTHFNPLIGVGLDVGGCVYICMAVSPLVEDLHSNHPIPSLTPIHQLIRSNNFLPFLQAFTTLGLVPLPSSQQQQYAISHRLRHHNLYNQPNQSIRITITITHTSTTMPSKGWTTLPPCPGPPPNRPLPPLPS
jgi:hypothetical protein